MPAMTYQEIADRLGIGLESAKNLARRKRWARASGNDGKARISVPDDALPNAPTRPPIDAPISPPIDPPPELLAKVAGLEAEVSGLREILARVDRQIDDLKGDRDAWRAQSEALADLLADRSRPWWKRLAG